MEIIILSRNVKPSRWNKALSWKHYTKKLHPLVHLLQINCQYILLKATTVNELLEFYSTNYRKIKSLFGKISTENIPHPPITVHSRDNFSTKYYII